MHGPSPAANEAFVRSATTFALRSCKRRFSSRSRARRSVTPVSRSHAPGPSSKCDRSPTRCSRRATGSSEGDSRAGTCRIEAAALELELDLGVSASARANRSAKKRLWLGRLRCLRRHTRGCSIVPIRCGDDRCGDEHPLTYVRTVSAV